jgi:predicted transcriptional regulator
MLRLLCLGETGKTEIMYTVSMGYRQIKRYLGRLMELDFVDEVKTPHRLASYRITKKGLELLGKIVTLQEMLHTREALDSFHAPEPTRTVAQDGSPVAGDR